MQNPQGDVSSSSTVWSLCQNDYSEAWFSWPFETGMGVLWFVKVSIISLSSYTNFRERDNGKTRESVKKILNGGGGLPLELIKDAVSIFPRAKLVSAYG